MAVTPNGTYAGGTDSAGTRGVLTITSSNPDNGSINAGSYTFGGTEYNVRGTFYYSDISNHFSSVTFDLTATPKDNSSTVYKISLYSADREYNNLSGDVRILGAAGGAQYTISLGKQ
jgi:hypothetical protein